MVYLALIRKDEDSSFGVEFPDFPGCISGGDTLTEAAAGAREALDLHVRGMLEDGDAIPEPSSLEEALASAEGEVVPMLVELSPPKGPAVRLNITLDGALLRRIDEAASRRGSSRSAFLAEAARHELEAS